MARVAFLGTGLLGGAMVDGMLRRGDAMTVFQPGGSSREAAGWRAVTSAPALN